MTRGQSLNKIWMHERGMRLNSSMFGEIVLKKNAHSKKLSKLGSPISDDRREELHKALKEFAKKLLNSPNLLHVPAIIRGHKYEIFAVRKFEDRYYVKSRECGSFVSLKTPYLAASPSTLR